MITSLVRSTSVFISLSIASALAIPVPATAATSSRWYFTNTLAGGPAQSELDFGSPSDADFLIGDWDGNGVDDLARRRGNTITMLNTTTRTASEISYGKATDRLYVGDWDGNGTDTFAVRRGNTFFVKNTVASGNADRVFSYGKAGDRVYVGDWDGDGDDTFAVRRGNVYFVKNTVSSGNADLFFGYGKAADSVMVGDWDGDRRDTFAVRRGNVIYLRNDLRTAPAETTFGFGKAADELYVGDWDGNGTDTFVVRRTSGEAPAAAPDGPAAQETANRPYRDSATVNTPIPDGVPTHPKSSTWLSQVNQNDDDGRMTSDVTQNSYTLYMVDNSTATRSITLENGYFSSYSNFGSNPDGDRQGHGYSPQISNVPIPPEVASGGGGDGQILFINTDTFQEWSFWRWDVDGDGIPNPTNGYVYDYRLGTGRTEKGGRGAGVAKYFGLVTADEVEDVGVIDHAIAVAFDGSVLNGNQYVYPATKSDGRGGSGDLLEGARLQLDPSLTEQDFNQMGLAPQAKVIARAMQEYGLIIVDKSGRNKVFLESSETGDWTLSDNQLEYLLNPLVDDGTSVDWSRHFRVLDFENWTGGTTGIIDER